MARLQIREVAERKNISMGLLSRKANVTMKVVQQVWRNPHHDILFSTLIKFATALDVPVTALIDDERNDAGETALPASPLPP